MLSSTRGTGARVPWLWLSIAVVFVGCAIAANLIGLPDPNHGNLADQFLPPFGRGASGSVHLLGTDGQGRDVLSRVIYGARASLAIAFGTVLLGGGSGSLLGLLSGYQGGWIDSLVMRATDTALAFPVLLLALVVAVVVGPGYVQVIFILSVSVCARYVRLVRGEVLVVREREYVLSSWMTGASSMWIVRRHVLPNVLGLIVVFATLQVGWTILMEASLSFLGAGVPLSQPAWGSMVAEGLDFLQTAWWVSVIPCVVIVLVVLAFNNIGDWLREMTDPRAHERVTHPEGGMVSRV